MLHKTAPISASTVPGLLGWVRFIQKSGKRECLVDSMCFTTASRFRLGFPVIHREEPAIADGASSQNVQTWHHKLATRNPSTSRGLNLQTLSTIVTALNFSRQSIHNIVMTTEEAVNEVLIRQRFRYLINRGTHKTGNHSNVGKQTLLNPPVAPPALRPAGGAQSFWP